MGPIKPLKSLGALNQSFRRFFCFQWLEAGFVSLRSREASADWLQGWRTWGSLSSKPQY
jgi:hypothetical protein